MYHRPVLAETAIDWLVTDTAGRYLDGTVGGGGHLVQLLERLGPSAAVLGLDRDTQAIEAASDRVGRDRRVRLRQGLYGELIHHAGQEEMLPLDGILLDLGVSSKQLDDSNRGFTYRSDAPLDMRMDQHSGFAATELLATCSVDELERIFREGGEVRGAARLARTIVEVRRSKPLQSSAELRGIVEELIPPHRQTKALSQIFQALRIEVNDELGQLDAGLNASLDALRPEGRLVVIAYHSLEDRRVKQFFRHEASRCTCPPDFPVCICGVVPDLNILTGRAIQASQEEVADNPRARTARLRAAERTVTGSTGENPEGAVREKIK